MNTPQMTAIALAAGLLACPAWAQITVYEHEGYRGRSVTLAQPMGDFRNAGFNDRASSAVVQGGRWEVCEDIAYGGSCVVLRPGSYPSLGGMGLNDQLSSARPADQRRVDPPAATPTGPQITFYEYEGYQGRSVTVAGPLRDFRSTGLNDRVSSAIVQGGRWEVCGDIAYGGSCVVLRPGSYATLGGLGLNDRLSSARPAEQRGEDPPAATPPGPQITFYERSGYQGRSFTVAGPTRDFRDAGFSDRASSAVVQGGRWEVCGNIAYGGSCVVLRPGNYPSLRGVGLDDQLSSARPTEPRRGDPIEVPVPVTPPPGPQITFYEHDGYRGRTFTTTQPAQDFRSAGFNDRASSAVVQGGRWEVCSDAGYGGSCVVLRPGSYPSLSGMGLNDQLSSARPSEQRRADAPDSPDPAATPNYLYRRRANEQVFEVPVTSVRAVVGAPTERCWIEQQQATSPSGNQTGRALLGAVIGGVIGHQIGGGTGRDIATAGGAVTGAVIGARSGRDDNAGPTQDVRRCTSVPSTVPTYWDVGYSFRGVAHQTQMTQAPGQMISVNRFGEPRQ